MASDAPPADPCFRAATDLDEHALDGRRRALAEAGAVVEGWSGTGTAGIALSGGGIRSATLSLGLLQAVARHGLMGHFDYVCTVSGGGYIGGFLRTLFLPQAQRGPHWCDPAGAVPPGIDAQHAYALGVLTSEPADREVDGPAPGQRLRNPIWWLLQHSRYLAPNGPSDYASAAAYLVRNWIAMLYVFAIAIGGLFTLGTLLLAGGIRLSPFADAVARVTTLRFAPTPAPPCPGCPPTPPAMMTVVHLSPWLFLAAVALACACACGLAYWMTENMRSNPQPLGSGTRDDAADSRRRFLRVALPTAALGAGVGTAVILWDVSTWHRAGPWAAPLRQTAGVPAWWIIAGGAGFIVVGVVIALAAYLRSCTRFPNPTAEMRRLLTAWLTTASLAALVLASAGLCDSLALALRARLPAVLDGGVGPLLSTVLIPAAAFAINRLSGLLAGRTKGGGLMGFLARHAAIAMLVAGVLLYGAVAILVDATVQALLWQGDAWGPRGLDARPAVVLVIVLTVLIGMTGRARGFINLSSLHQLYAARLTRAYLGATNPARLALDGDTHTIKESDAGDHIEPRAFYTVPTTAPI
ncbi:hypothetical protein, partial [Sphingomonas solaris]